MPGTLYHIFPSRFSCSPMHLRAAPRYLGNRHVFRVCLCDHSLYRLYRLLSPPYLGGLLVTTE